MAKMVEQTCWCGTKFQAREADVKRGWGKSCCKSHASWKREKAKGPKGLIEKDRRIARAALMDSEEYEPRMMDEDDDPSWDAHKSWT